MYLYNVIMKAIEKFLNHFDGNQTKAAEALGVKQQNIWWWSNKAKDIPLEYIPKAAEILKCKPSELRPDFKWF